MKDNLINKIRDLLQKPENIRNISVIAHVDHGKTTLTDSLLARVGLINENQAGKTCHMDTDPKEKEMGITIKSTGVSLFYENPLSKVETLINLIDSPGHIDFSGEVTAALRVTDGAVVVVDAVEGVAVQTETVLRQACSEKIRPVLVINKLDRLLSELKDDNENIYQRIVSIIAKVNSIIETHTNESLEGGYTLDPARGNVAFASGKQCWGFTLRTFARMYSSRFGVPEDKLILRLWGDNFYSQTSKTFSDSASAEHTRFFVSQILKPLSLFYNAAQLNESEVLSKMVEKLNLTNILPPAELARFTEYDQQERIKRAMRAWLPLADNLFEMIQDHLPSPKEAMVYRSKYLYDGPEDDEACIAMKNCDSKGPLMLYISKMIPTADFSRFYAFGRVFSGTIAQGLKVRVQGPDYKPGSKEDLMVKTIQRTFLMMGKNHEPMDSIPAGGIVMVLGVDNAIIKTGTITTSETASNIRSMKYTISPILRVAVSVSNQQDLQKLIDGLKMLQKYDPLVLVEIDENTGSYIVACGGELHMKICIDKLSEFTHNSINIQVSQPTVSYRESVDSASAQVCMAKTANKLNRFYGTCEPLENELGLAIENNKFLISEIGQQKNVDQLAEEFNWNRDDAKRIWCFGPIEKGATNCIVNQTQGVQNLQAIQPSVISAFDWCVKEGLLCEEPLRNVRFNLTDANIHVDPAHYRGNQVIPAARRLFKATQYVSNPSILEPVYLCEIKAPQESVGSIYSVLNKRRGTLIDEQYENTMTIIQAYLPVSSSFGFDQELKTETQGKGLPSFKFSHWDPIPGSCFNPESKAGKVVAEIRSRKGLPLIIPELSQYLDKL